MFERLVSLIKHSFENIFSQNTSSILSENDWPGVYIAHCIIDNKEYMITIIPTDLDD